MKYLIPLFAILVAGTLVSCSQKKEDPTAAADWLPEKASVARHITSVHGFVIENREDAHMRVEMSEKKVTCTFREDVFDELGGEKALFILGWEQNPQEVSRQEYLFFLEALHAYLVLNHPQWDGGEGKG